MENSPAPSNSEKAAEVKQGTADETRFIAEFTKMTGGSEAQARNIFMYSDIIQQRDSYSYHLE